MYKLSDMPHFAGMKTRFDSKKPFDLFGSVPPDLCGCMPNRGHETGVPVAIENKMHKKRAGFAFSQIKEHQREALSDWEENGKGRAYVFLNIRINADGVRPRMNRLVVFPWRELRMKILSSARKSIPWRELDAMPFVEGKKERFLIPQVVRLMGL